MRDEFMITRQGKQYVLFAGLLDEAHTRGLVGIDTELVQVPEENNGSVAIVKATVQIEDTGGSGELRTFSGVGDASPQNVSRNIVPHLIRMAETRAKARALRDAVNVGATALEEISDDDSPGDGRGGTGLREARGNESRGGERRSGQHQRGAQNSSGGTGQQTRNDTDQATEKPGPRPVEAEAGEQPRTSRGDSKAPQSQIDFIRTLAEEWRGDKGVERLESRIGKPITELSRDEAEAWIDRLTPKDQSDAEEAVEERGG